MRTIVVFSGMVLFAIMVVSSLVKIQFVEGAHWRALADSLSTREFTLEAVRGNIFDCNRNLLATSLPIYDIRIDAKAPSFTDEELFQESIDSLSNQLAALFADQSAQAYKQTLVRIRREGNRYFLFKRKITYHQMRALTQMPIFRTGKYKGGLLIDERTRREKPFGLLAERTIGFKQ